MFDAKSGVRYADSALRASNAVSAASAVAASVRAAVVKSHQTSQDLHTVGLLSVRNADLPRQFDSICDSVGLLLERELTASTGIAVLERRRLEQVNQERGVAPDAEGNRLLSSLRMMQLDIGRDGEGLRGTLAFVGADGARGNEITASVPTRDPAALAHLLADKTEQFLNVPADGIPSDREAEATRFHREYGLLLAHHDYLAAIHVLDAAIALSPEQKKWQQEMALLLPNAAIEIIDPGGQVLWGPLATQPSAEKLSACLALGQRGTDLLLDLSREATAQAKPGGPFPEVRTYSFSLHHLLEKLAEVETADPASAAEIAALAGKERTLLMEVIEPFMIKQSVDADSFETYSETIGHWFMPPAMLNEQDALLVMSHWVETSHKLNPPDGSGIYDPLYQLLVLPAFKGDQFKEFLQTLELDQDPVIRLCARAGRVAFAYKTTSRGNIPTDVTLVAEREFRLYAQDLLVHGETAKSVPFRSQVWDMISQTLRFLLNHPNQGNEYLEACRFAFAQKDIQPGLFYQAAEALEMTRYPNVTGELEVVNGALRLILDKPDDYPKLKYSYSNRSEVIKDLQQKRDRLVAELAGTNTNVPAASLWKQSVCLLDLAKPMHGLAKLLKPLVQDEQVYAVALGLQEWGLPEDCLQLVRVSLAGGSPSFLGQTKFSVINPDDRKFGYGFVRAACVGADCYFAATGSGVFIFPTNGDPVLHLGTTNGLPSDDIHAVAFLNGKLYIGAGETDRGGYIASYDPDTRKIAVLASSRRSEHLSPFDDQPPFCAIGLTADPSRQRLLMAVSSDIIPNVEPPDIAPCMGIWSYLPSTGEFKRLAPLRLLCEPEWMRDDAWFEMVDANTVALKGFRLMALFDLRNDRLISAYDPWEARTNAAIRFWERPTPGSRLSGSATLADGPFFLCNGWFYSAQPFERMALADGRREKLPPPRTDSPFEPAESLQLLADGKHILAADQISFWLLELKPQPADASVGNGNNSPVVPEQ